MLVEEFVDGIEVEVGVLGNRDPIASIPGEIVVTENEWYDYEAKYVEGEMELIVPARISPEQLARAQELAVRAFVVTDCEGMARVDMFVRQRRRGARERAEHDPRLHADERLREALRGVGDRATASCSSGSSTSRSSGTSGGAGSSSDGVRGERVGARALERRAALLRSGRGASVLTDAVTPLLLDGGGPGARRADRRYRQRRRPVEPRGRRARGAGGAVVGIDISEGLLRLAGSGWPRPARTT